MHKMYATDAQINRMASQIKLFAIFLSLSMFVK